MIHARPDAKAERINNRQSETSQRLPVPRSNTPPEHSILYRLELVVFLGGIPPSDWEEVTESGERRREFRSQPCGRCVARPRACGSCGSGTLELTYRCLFDLDLHKNSARAVEGLFSRRCKAYSRKGWRIFHGRPTGSARTRSNSRFVTPILDTNSRPSMKRVKLMLNRQARRSRPRAAVPPNTARRGSERRVLQWSLDAEPLQP